MDVWIADDYTGPIQTYTFNDVLFAYDCYDQYNWLIPMAIKENKVINITNKKFSFHPIEMKSHDSRYRNAAETLFQSIPKDSPTNIVDVSGAVFQFFDYESSTSTSHSVDFLTHALYFYFQGNHSPAKLLIPATAHASCIRFLDLLKRWFPISYFVVQPPVWYRFQHFSCVRSYLNVHLPEVKGFFTRNLLEPIVQSCSVLPSPQIVARIKRATPGTQTPGSAFPPSESFAAFCKKYEILELDDEIPEELKIYYLNKADCIYVSWGSIYYIYINYYLISAKTKQIGVLFHTSMMGERQFLLANDSPIYSDGLGIYHQCIAHNCGSLTDQLYNLFSFQGEVLHNLESLDEVVKKTRLLDDFKKREEE